MTTTGSGGRYEMPRVLGDERMLDLLLRPEGVFTAAELASLIAFVEASSIRPEGPGGRPFDLTNRPYLRVLYAEQRRAPFRRLVIEKAAQTGLTIKLLYRAAWLTSDANQQINTALLFPNKDLVLELHKSRFRPMIQSSERMMKLVGDVDAVDLVRIGVSNMRFRGMRTGTGLDSFPADVLLADEVRLMAQRNIARVLNRVAQSSLIGPGGIRGLVELNSTAGFPGMDIDAWFQRSDMNYWHTPCPNPACKNHTAGICLPLRWPDCVGVHDGLRTYQCPDCLEPIHDDVLMQQGFYVPKNPEATFEGVPWRGYQFSQCVNGNGFLRTEIWPAWAAQDNMDDFWNSRMGLPFQNPDAIPASREVVLKCVSETYLWPEAFELEGEWVSVGIDQRAPEKHLVAYKLGPGGAFDLVHVRVIEESGMRAAHVLARVCEELKAKIVIIDGEPSYDLAVELARRLPKGMVWFADYAESPHVIQWSDERDKESIRKSTGEVKHEYRVLMDRYKGLDWSLLQFVQRRVRLPANWHELVQGRTEGGITRGVNILEEWLDHLSNLARATIPRYQTLENGEKVQVGVRYIYRHLALDPHFGHADLYAKAGLARRAGGTEVIMAGFNDPKDGDAPPQLERVLPVGIRPSDLEAADRVAKDKVCGNCRFWLPPNKDSAGLCSSKAQPTYPNRLQTDHDSPACPSYVMEAPARKVRR